MKPIRILTVASVLALVVPTLVVVGPAAGALERFGDAPGDTPVFLEPVETTPVLYFRDVGNPSDQTEKRLGLLTEVPKTARDPPAAGGSIADTETRPRTKTSLAVPAVLAQQPPEQLGDPYRARFTFDPYPAAAGKNYLGLRYDFTIRGANNFVTFTVTGTPGLKYTVELLDKVGGAVVATGDKTEDATGVAAADKRVITIPLALTQQRTTHTFKAGDHPTVVLYGAQPQTSAGGQDTGTWTLLYDEKELAPSRIELTASDALKVATWTQNRVSNPNQQPIVTTLFRNLTARSDYPSLVQNNRYLHVVDGWHVVRSAFGLADIASMTPTAEILNATRDPIRIKPWNPATTMCNQLPAATTIPMKVVTQNDDRGIRTFRFQRLGDTEAPACLIRDYWHLNHTADAAGVPTRTPAGGEYILRMKSEYRPSDAAKTNIISSSRFLISAVSISLTPFSDGDAVETTSHALARSGQTTFLLRLRNSGASNDTIKIDVELVTRSNPSHSWTADPIVPLLGDAQQVGANLFRLGPGNFTILGVTIRGPNALDATAVYRVTAQSQTDPSAVGATDTAVLTAGPTFDPASPPAVTNKPGVVLLRTTEKVVPGEAKQVSAFLWNRHVAPQDITTRLLRSNVDGWQVSLVENNRPVETITVTGVPAGGVAGVSMRASLQRGAEDTTYNVEVAARLPAGGVEEAKRALQFVADIRENFEIRILEGIADRRHLVEVWNSPTRPSDYLNGTWYRVWITNNAAQTSTYQITVPSVIETPTPPQSELTANPTNVIWPTAVGHRDAAGRFTTANDVTVEPGKTAERWVWVGHDGDAGKRATATGADIVIRVVRDPSSSTPEVRSRTVRVDVQNALAGSEARGMGVLLEPVGRTADFSLAKPYVDLSKQNTLRTEGAVPIGEFAHYRLRVTNGASWWFFEDPISSGLFWDHRPEISISGVDQDLGWSAYYRLAKADSEGKPAPLPSDCIDPADPEGKRVHPDLTNRALWLPSGDTLKYPPLLLNAAGGPARPAHPIADLNSGKGRDGFWDAELEILVCPPPANHPSKPLAGAQDQIQVQVRQIGPRGLASTALRDVTTYIAGVPSVEVKPRADRVIVPTTPANRGTAIVPVFIANNGSYLTNVTVAATFDGPSNGWTITGATVVNLTPLRAFENRTLAFRVIAPAGAGDQIAPAKVKLTASYHRNLYDPTSPILTATGETIIEATSRPQDLGLVFDTNNQCTGTTQAVTCTAQLPTTSGDQPPPVSIPVRLSNNLATPLTVTVSTPTMPGWVFTNNRFSYSKEITIPGNTGSGSNVVAETILVTPPKEATSGSFADLVITARQNGDPTHVQTKVARVVIAGGLFLGTLDVARGKEFVERNDTARFPVSVRNTGNVDGTMRLQALVDNINRAEGTNDPRLCRRGEPQCWEAWLEDDRGNRLDANAERAASIFLRKNELRLVNLTVKAPFFEQENAFAKVRLTVWNASNLLQELGKIEVTAEIQDYGVEVSPSVEQMTLIPGLSGSLLVLIRNTGDANDTLNLSLDTGGLPWSYTYSSPDTFLTPGSSTGVRLTIQTPIDPLPAARTAKFWIYVGTRGGQDVNVSRYDSKPLFVTIPQYRQLDVDGDNITELAVDADRDLTNGYEAFYEYSSLVRVTKQVDKALGKDRKTKLLLDIPSQSGAYDNVADAYWDPDQNIVTRVARVFDLDKDQTSDYLLDTDGDGIVDSAYQAATRQFLKTDRVKILGNDAGFQYLLDTNGDGKPDKYYDPGRNVITRLVPSSDLGPNVYGVDTDDDGKTDAFYDYKTQTVTPAAGVKIVDFAREYWYVFLGFLAVVALFGVVLMKRRTP